MSVALPLEFIAIKFPGYFYNTKDKKLYSIKIDGVLKPLKFSRGYYGPSYTGGYIEVEPGYNVSHKGVQKRVTLKYLESLDPEHFTLIPVVKGKGDTYEIQFIRDKESVHKTPQ